MCIRDRSIAIHNISYRSLRTLELHLCAYYLIWHWDQWFCCRAEAPCQSKSHFEQFEDILGPHRGKNSARGRRQEGEELARSASSNGLIVRAVSWLIGRMSVSTGSTSLSYTECSVPIDIGVIFTASSLHFATVLVELSERNQHCYGAKNIIGIKQSHRISWNG